MRCGILVISALAALSPASAQWLNYPTPGIPRTPDGKPNLSAPAPKTADGKPDLSGLWTADSGNRQIELTADATIFDRPSGGPLQPWAAAIDKQHREMLLRDDPSARCLPLGPPRMDRREPHKILQFPGLIVILYEANTLFRQIFLDGRALPKDPNPTWMGYSVGHWEGDTLVVETTGFNDDVWIWSGHPHTASLRTVERFRRRDFGHMDLQVTIDDPKTYTKPWTLTFDVQLIPDSELLESICNENNTNAPHLVGK
jgi:hypothetical protein